MKKHLPLIGERRYKHSSLLLKYSDAIDGKMKEATREVTHVFTDPEGRGSGSASQLMSQVCAEADVEQKLLILFPKPYINDTVLNQEELIEWYAKFDFDIIQATPVVMMARGALPPAVRAQMKKTQQILENMNER